MVKKTKKPNTKVGPYLKDKLGEVKMLSEVSSEITYQIPASLSNKFKNFFEEFDNKLNSLGLNSYGISVITLEEVFLKVGHPDNLTNHKPESLKEDDGSYKINLPSYYQKLEDYSIADRQETGRFNVFWIHLGALFKKKFNLYKKNYKGLLAEILVPILLCIIGFGLTKV